MSEVRVESYHPLPKQQAFHDSNARFRLFQGGWGAGKTRTGVQEAIDVSMAYPRNEGMILRKTYRELEDTTKQTFFEVCPPELIQSYLAKHEVVTLVNGSRILFRSLDREAKIRGINLGWFYIDEASEIEDEDVPLVLDSRLRLSRVPWHGGWFTTNPPGLDHWLYDWFVKKPANSADERARFFMVQSTSFDNPYNPPNYAEDLAKDYSPQWVRRFILGEFGNITPGTSVYENWSDSQHVVEGLEWRIDRPIIRAWDFGFHHPCVLYAQYVDRTLYILEEDMGDRVLFHKFRDHIIEEGHIKYPGASFIDVGDPAARQHGDKDERNNVDLLKEKGITLITRRQKKKRIIELINQRLAMIRLDRKTDKAHPVIQVSKEGCPILIRGFQGGYAWPKPRDGKMLKESPMEDGYFEHPHDCLQYIVSAVFLGGAVVGSPVSPATPSYWNV